MAIGVSNLVGGALGAVGGIFGGIGKNKALRRMRRALEAQKKENQNWYDRRYNEDATQRADALRVLENTRQLVSDNIRRNAGTSAVMGGTEEAAAAAREAGSKAITDAASNIALAAENRKDAIENQYMARNNELQSQIDNLNGQKKSFFDIAADTVGGAAEGLKTGLWK